MKTVAAIAASVETVVRGKHEQVLLALVPMIAGGHLLLQDVPGVGKSTLAQALGQSIGASYSRIQFTSDLLPADILGVNIYEVATGEFRFPARPDLRERRHGGRDQQGQPQDPVRASRGYERSTHHHRRDDMGVPGPVLRHRHAESHRVCGHLSSSRERTGPLPAVHWYWIPGRRGGTQDPDRTPRTAAFHQSAAGSLGPAGAGRTDCGRPGDRWRRRCWTTSSRLRARPAPRHCSRWASAPGARSICSRQSAHGRCFRVARSSSLTTSRRWLPTSYLTASCVAVVEKGHRAPISTASLSRCRRLRDGGLRQPEYHESGRGAVQEVSPG